ncbi:MAG: molecular chaperone HtpG [Ignavibacteria bacterium GWF2_33_9]|nr:MAG: molecular chaperone HtpG [Ignavibacteria bacterium GWF2_33_9]
MTESNHSEKYQFQAEMKQLLNLIIHSLYSHKEVFLRELVSNASDALNKVRFLKLTKPDILNPDDELAIKINVNFDENTFSIEDSGIGMSHDDLINQIGNIASSGTLKFLNELKEKNKSFDGNLIGQFGVGFYSVFMVTDEVTLETRLADSTSHGLQWISTGEDTYIINEIDKPSKGTKISFKFKEELKHFADVSEIKQILQKYSNFVDFPIYVNDEKVNVVQAVWQKKKDSLTDEEMNEFYKFISNDFEEPMGHLHLAIEGNVNFKALLFIPKTAPQFLFQEIKEKTLHLYTNKIFIQDDAKELLPDYLHFVKGVVDTEDLPLNVSREITQNSPVMAKINTVLTSKILDYLENLASEDKEKYETFYRNFGSLLKSGVNTDFKNREKIIELMRFESSKTEAGNYTSFNSYVSSMRAEQEEIFYLAGDSREKIERNPNLEYFIKNDIEVLFMIDPMDVFVIPYIFDYSGKKILSIEKAEIKLEESSSEEKTEDNQNSFSLIEKFKSVVGEQVEDIVFSKRLVNYPVSLVAGKSSMDPQYEKMMQMLNKDFQSSKKILEINPVHPIIKNLISNLNNTEHSEEVEDTIHQLYESALLIDGGLTNPTDFVQRLYKIIEKMTK